MTKLLSKLSKSEILSLPGFDRYLQSKFDKAYQTLKIRELKPLLKKSIKQLNINFRGVRVNDYVNRFNEIKADDDLFNRMSSMKHQQQKQHRQHDQYKQSLKIQLCLNDH